MIPHLDPFSANGMGFATLSLLAVLAAWAAPSRFPIVLAGLSAVMLASWLKPVEALLLVIFMVPPYAVARLAWGRAELERRWPVAAIILWQVLFFAVLRGYPGFALLRPWDQPLTIIGLSYVLFRQIHLVAEAGQLGRLTLTPLSYFNFCLAFWTLLAGPIQRYHAFVEGMAELGRPAPAETLAAAHRAINGMIKAFLLAPLFLAPSKVGLLARPGADWWDAAVVFYGFPIYILLNFSGYTDLVIAVARLCGMRGMPENFDRPYLARNIQEFWNRWHMSLSGWIRDHLFQPLSLAVHRRVPARQQNLALAATVLVVFLAVGAWHGTTASFFLFGLLHGIAVIVVALWGAGLKRRLGRQGKKTFEARPAVRWAATALTFHFVAATMMLVNNPLDEVVSALAAFLRS